MLPLGRYALTRLSSKQNFVAARAETVNPPLHESVPTPKAISASTLETKGATAKGISKDPLTGMQIRIGVMGSADGQADANVAELCRRLGRTIAENGCCLLTGACPGLPHIAALGAKECDGHVVGISPAATLKEHVELFGSPYEEYDQLIFTGLG